MCIYTQAKTIRKVFTCKFQTTLLHMHTPKNIQDTPTNTQRKNNY